MTTFYLATCQQCDPVLPVPFYDPGDRDDWATGHTQMTGHPVVTSTEHR